MTRRSSDGEVAAIAEGDWDVVVVSKVEVTATMSDIQVLVREGRQATQVSIKLSFDGVTCHAIADKGTEVPNVSSKTSIPSYTWALICT